MHIEKLTDANPWWTTKQVPEEWKGKKRETYSSLLQSLTIREITIITGVRRSGKSTLMYQMVDGLLQKGVPAEQILFINLEDNRTADDSLDDIYRTYREQINPTDKTYFFLDEIHRRTNWESWIRTQYDRYRDCKFVISGSCSYLLRREYSTLLTGRNLTYEIFPLSFKEFLSFKDISVNDSQLKKGLILERQQYVIINAFQEYLRYGGFPEIVQKDLLFKTKILAQYFDDILYKDIVDRYMVNSRKVKDLALYLLTNITGEISLRSLRAKLGLSYESIKDYLSYYAEAFFLFAVNHFSYSMKTQKMNPSKIFCIDTGLRNAVSFRFSQDEGKLAENLVMTELKRRGDDVYYWKSGKQHEIDCVIKNKDQTLIAINSTYTDKINSRECASLKEFADEFPKTQKLICITKNVEKQEQGITYIPLWKWLLG